MDFETLKERYTQNRISLAMLKVYVRKGIITPEQFKEITGRQIGAKAAQKSGCCGGTGGGCGSRTNS